MKAGRSRSRPRNSCELLPDLRRASRDRLPVAGPNRSVLDVPRAYRTVRDHLDDITGFARCVFEQAKTTKPARLAELQFEITDRFEQIEGSLELGRIKLMPLPLDRLRKALEKGFKKLPE